MKVICDNCEIYDKCQVRKGVFVQSCGRFKPTDNFKQNQRSKKDRINTLILGKTRHTEEIERESHKKQIQYDIDQDKVQSPFCPICKSIMMSSRKCRKCGYEKGVFISTRNDIEKVERELRKKQIQYDMDLGRGGPDIALRKKIEGTEDSWLIKDAKKKLYKD